MKENMPTGHEPEALSLTPAEKVVVGERVLSVYRSMSRQNREAMYSGMGKREIIEQLKEYYAERISALPDGNFMIRQSYGFYVVDSKGKMIEGKGVCVKG